MVWQAYSAGRFPVVPHAEHSHARPNRSIIPGRSGSAFPVQPVCLSAGSARSLPTASCFQEQQQLRCVDPISGETLWSRTDIPAGCELFGDDEFVLAAERRRSVALRDRA